MKVRTDLMAGVMVFVCAFVFSVANASAEKKMPDTVTLKLEGAKMAPVTFSHVTHAQKAKIDCAVCHHKDKDPKEARACRTCHQVAEGKDNAPPAKDVFHKKCQTCHKESTAKGVNAPTKCGECHKK
jgi:hypothetical protein